MIAEHGRTVLAFAAFVALLVFASAFLTDHNGDIDELGLYNPSYMLAHYGKLTYPVHGYYDQPVIVHPPIHVGLIGLLLRAGLTWYYAEAIPAAFFFFLAVALAARLPAPAIVRLSFLFSIGFVALGGEFLRHWPAPWGFLFGTRPEGEVYAAWMSGLLLLETGRLMQWNRTRLFFGAFLLVWAAAAHYYAWPSMVGVLVYVTLAIIDLGWKPALSKAAALIAGACLFGSPYLAFYVMPHLKEILDVARYQSGSGGTIAESIRAHSHWYRIYAPVREFSTPIRMAFGLGIPLFLLSTAAMCMVRATRVVALAALPLMLAVFLVTPHKQFGYLIHEMSFFLIAGSLMVLSAGAWLCGRIKVPAIQRIFPAAAAVLLGSYLIGSNDVVQGVLAAVEPTVQEGEVARAAARNILGTHAKVTSRMGMWYVAGAAYWHDIQWDILAFPDSYDPVHYFSNFDAAVDHLHASELATKGGSTLSAWYAGGMLKLRGFFFGETNPELQYLLLSLDRPRQVLGYAMKKGRLYRFEEQSGGDQALTASVCAAAPGDAIKQLRRTAAPFAILRLPDMPPYPSAVIIHVLAPRGAEPPAPWLTNCTPLHTVAGTLVPVDKMELVRALRREDAPIHFAYGLEDLPGYRETGTPTKITPPSDSVRLDHVLEPSKLIADSKRSLGPPAQFLVTTPGGMGSFAAHVPVAHGEAVDMPCWVELRLRVLHGRVGFLVSNRSVGQLKQAPAYLGKTEQPVEVALSMPSLKNANLVTIFNAGLDRPSQVEILDATVLVSRDAWARNQTSLSTVR